MHRSTVNWCTLCTGPEESYQFMALVFVWFQLNQLNKLSVRKDVFHKMQDQRKEEVAFTVSNAILWNICIWNLNLLALNHQHWKCASGPSVCCFEVSASDDNRRCSRKSVAAAWKPGPKMEWMPGCLRRWSDALCSKLVIGRLNFFSLCWLTDCNNHCLWW